MRFGYLLHIGAEMAQTRLHKNAVLHCSHTQSRVVLFMLMPYVPVKVFSVTP